MKQSAWRKLMSRRKWWVAFAVVAISVCAWMVTKWTSVPNYAWQQVESSDGHFRVNFPGPATTSQEQGTASDGTKYVMNKLTASPVRRVIYALSWWEHPVEKNKTTDELFAYLRECDVNAFHGSVAFEKALTVEGYPARDVLLYSKEFMVLNRFIRVGPRIYSLWVVSPRSQPQIENGGKFLNSFSLN